MATAIAGDLLELFVAGCEADEEQDQREDREHQCRVAVLVLRADRLEGLTARRA